MKLKMICPICGEELVRSKYSATEYGWDSAWVHLPVEPVNFEDSESIFNWTFERNIWKVHHKEVEEMDIKSIDDVLAFEEEEDKAPFKIEVVTK
jgi:hypothetical protein